MLALSLGCTSEPAVPQAAPQPGEVSQVRQSDSVDEEPPGPRTGRSKAGGSGEQQQRLEDGPPGAPATSLSGAELLRLCAASTQPSTRAVTDQGLPLGSVQDLDRDGMEDAVILTVETKDPSQRLLRNLADFSKLFQEESPSLPVFAEVFHQRPGGRVERTLAIPLGGVKVLESFGGLPWPPGTEAPAGVELAVPTASGRERTWVLFGQAGYRIFSFREDARHVAVTRDIDADGVVDLLVFETSLEEGTGFETFILWYRWDGRTYRQVRSINVLRNLRSFLDQCRDLLVAKQWRRIIETMLLPQDATRYRGRPEDLPADLLEPASFGQAVDDPASRQTAGDLKDLIKDLVFPRLPESPFLIRDNEIGTAKIPVKILYTTGETYYYSLRLGFSPNPFGSRQFVLLPD